MNWKKSILSILCVLITAIIPISSDIQASSSLPAYEDYGLFAMWFIASDKLENEDSGWDANTRIHDITEIYDVNNQLTGYTFELTNRGKNNGYILVLNVNGELSVAEFSYEEFPQYHISKLNGMHDKVYFASSLEYFIEEDDKLYTVDEQEVEPAILMNHPSLTKQSYSMKLPDSINSDLSTFLRDAGSLDQFMESGLEDSAASFAPMAIVEIPDIYDYLIKTYGTGWGYNDHKTLSITPMLQVDFREEQNNCTLSSLAQAFRFFRSSYPEIPSNIYRIYDDIEAIAISNGYTAKGGTPPTKIDDIITDIWREYGYRNGKGNNDYALTFGTFKREIIANRPVLFNMANGYYSNHTVLVKGYRIYEKSGIFNDDKNFLRINDNWETGYRWIDYSSWGCCGSASKFITP